MPNYQKGQIYSIRRNKTEDVYIGSTTIKLSQRMSLHRQAFKRWKEKKGPFVTSFHLLEHEDAYIELIENFPCETKYELHKREGQIMRITDNCVNKQIAGRTYKEYCEDNPEKIKEKNAFQYQKNKEELKEKKVKYYEENRDRILEQKKKYKENNPERVKEIEKKTKEKNKDKINVQRKKYRQENKDKLKEYRDSHKEIDKERRKQKITCECGETITFGCITKHKKRKKHLLYLESLQ